MGITLKIDESINHDDSEDPQGNLVYGGYNMIKEYRNHSNAILIETGKDLDGLPIKEQLKGLKINLTDLQELIAIGGESLDHVMLLFAVSSEDVSKPKSEQDFTIILAGVNKEVIDGEDVYIIDKNNYMNKFSPCPSACPQNIDSLYT